MPIQIKEFISDVEMEQLEKEGKAYTPDFISDEEMTRLETKQQPQGLSFLGRTKERFGERAQKFEESVQRQERGLQGTPSTLTQLLGQGAGFVGDVAGEAISTVPGVKKAQQGLSFLFGKAAATKPAQEIGARYQQYKEQNPREAANLEATTNLGLSFLGARGGAAATEKAIKAGPQGIKFLAKSSEKKALQEALEITKPVFDKRGSIAAFEQAGQPGGVTKKGILGRFEVEPSLKSQEVAESVKGFVTKNKGPIDNIVSVNSEIARISDNEIRPFLKANPAPFNLKTLNARLQTISPPDFIKADPVLQKTYDLVRQKMIDVVSKSKKTTEGLWDSRKQFDSIAKRQLGNLDPLSGQGSAIKQAVLDMRRGVNNFIADSVPNGDANFKAQMRRLSNMYEARANIAETNYRLLDKNALQRWAKQNPGKAKLFGKTITAIGLGWGGYEILN